MTSVNAIRSIKICDKITLTFIARALNASHFAAELLTPLIAVHKLYIHEIL
jgi:hypothetical protein